MTESYFHNFTRCLDKAYGVNNLGEQLQDLSERGKYQPAIVVMRTEPSARNDLIKTDGELDPDALLRGNQRITGAATDGETSTGVPGPVAQFTPAEDAEDFV
jgi:hypothetical protein